MIHTPMIVVPRLSVEQASSEQLPEFHSTVWATRMEEFCSAEQQLCLRRLLEAQRLGEMGARF